MRDIDKALAAGGALLIVDKVYPPDFLNLVKQQFLPKTRDLNSDKSNDLWVNVKLTTYLLCHPSELKQLQLTTQEIALVSCSLMREKTGAMWKAVCGAEQKESGQTLCDLFAKYSDNTADASVGSSNTSLVFPVNAKIKESIKYLQLSDREKELLKDLNAESIADHLSKKNYPYFVSHTFKYQIEKLLLQDDLFDSLLVPLLREPKAFREIHCSAESLKAIAKKLCNRASVVLKKFSSIPDLLSCFPGENKVRLELLLCNSLRNMPEGYTRKNLIDQIMMYLQRKNFTDSFAIELGRIVLSSNPYHDDLRKTLAQSDNRYNLFERFDEPTLARLTHAISFSRSDAPKKSLPVTAKKDAKQDANKTENPADKIIRLRNQLKDLNKAQDKSDAKNDAGIHLEAMSSSDNWILWCKELWECYTNTPGMTLKAAWENLQYDIFNNDWMRLQYAKFTYSVELINEVLKQQFECERAEDGFKIIECLTNNFNEPEKNIINALELASHDKKLNNLTQAQVFSEFYDLLKLSENSMDPKEFLQLKASIEASPSFAIAEFSSVSFGKPHVELQSSENAADLKKQDLESSLASQEESDTEITDFKAEEASTKRGGLGARQSAFSFAVDKDTHGNECGIELSTRRTPSPPQLSNNPNSKLRRLSGQQLVGSTLSAGSTTDSSLESEEGRKFN